MLPHSLLQQLQKKKKLPHSLILNQLWLTTFHLFKPDYCLKKKSFQSNLPNNTKQTLQISKSGRLFSSLQRINTNKTLCCWDGFIWKWSQSICKIPENNSESQKTFLRVAGLPQLCWRLIQKNPEQLLDQHWPQLSSMSAIRFRFDIQMTKYKIWKLLKYSKPLQIYPVNEVTLFQILLKYLRN